MKSIPDKSVDMILCDLPYGTTACKWDTIIPFEPLWEQYERITKENGAIVLTACQPFTSVLVTSNIKRFRYDLVWQKTHPKGHLNAKKQPMRAHESILIFSKQPTVYNPQKTVGHKRKVAKTEYTKEHEGNSVYGREVRNTNYDSTERYPLSVQIFPNADLTKVLHPTQKPVELFEYLIRTYTNEGDLVLDNCAGSGTTAIACLNTKRRYICIEKDETYFNTMSNRIINWHNEWLNS
jgi:site-specific DNA-methyltransferase (adenine-specific)